VLERKGWFKMPLTLLILLAGSTSIVFCSKSKKGSQIYLGLGL
jgi:hypothetical protein